MVGVKLEELLARDNVALVLQEIQNGVVGEDSTFPALAEARRPWASSIMPLAWCSGANGWCAGRHATAQNLPGRFGGNRNARLFAAARRAGGEYGPGSDSVLPVADVDKTAIWYCSLPRPLAYDRWPTRLAPPEMAGVSTNCRRRRVPQHSDSELGFRPPSIAPTRWWW